MVRVDLEAKYGRVWSTSEVTEDFEVHSFLAPYCVVTRKNDGVKGVLEFNDRPRYYFDFKEIK